MQLRGFESLHIGLLFGRENSDDFTKAALKSPIVAEGVSEMNVLAEFNLIMNIMEWQDILGSNPVYVGSRWIGMWYIR